MLLVLDQKQPAHKVLGAIIYTLFALFAAFCYPFMRKRIPFSKAVLQCVM